MYLYPIFVWKNTYVENEIFLSLFLFCFLILYNVTGA